ncbi:MAG: DUF1638 domain-containing protein [Proteobacteria bacterium]|nr:DUF1638 domain-containing protein [Pseudomonadota bacterium]MBU4130391.1 DUF1638 domain-containing protein [Pseudomonadota bacterium]
MGKEKDIIVCKIFENELKAVACGCKDMRFHWIDAASHANPVKMKAEISSAISKIESPESEICFLLGNGCHPDMCSIAKQHDVLLPEEKNCIHAFLGVERTKELEQNRTMIITPGWLDSWRNIMDGLGWDQVDVRINIGRYDRILLLDPGLIPLNDDALIAFYDQVQVPIEIMEISLDYFKEFVNKVINSRQ